LREISWFVEPRRPADALHGTMAPMNERVAAPEPVARPRYLESPKPLVFPSEEMVPETQLHLELRTLLYQLLSDYLGLSATVGSDQFVYYAADDPRQCLAPDAFVKLTPRGDDIVTWKTWERGAPEVAVEIVSESDFPELPWQEKLARYARLGAKEVIRFNPKAPVGSRLRIWDRVSEVLTEREVLDDTAPSLVLNLAWVVTEADGRPVALRIARDEAGTELVPTYSEARRADLARIVELEAELKRRQ
jgi:Uma2 family endonuclease